MACAQEHRNGKTLILWFWTVMCGGSGATHSLRVKPILEISLSATFDTSLRLFARTDWCCLDRLRSNSYSADQNRIDWNVIFLG